MAAKNDGRDENEKNLVSESDDFSHSTGKSFEIILKCCLDSHRTEWLVGVEVKLLKNGEIFFLGP